MNDRELFKRALKALRDYEYPDDRLVKVMEDVKARLAEDTASKHEYISNEAYDCMGREALP